MKLLRHILWRWRMKKVRPGMTEAEVERRLGQPSRKDTSDNVQIWIYDLDRIRDMLYSIRVAFMTARVSCVYIGMEACEAVVSQKTSALSSAPEPFMEHPSGEYDNAIAAMEDAVCRLRALPQWDQWITFCAQGENPERPGTIKFAEVQILDDQLSVGDRPLDLATLTQKAKIPLNAISSNGSHYSLTSLSARDVALLLDAIFVCHFGIRPFADEGTDYAVGAEW
jgi:hypothetical protein